MFNSYHYTLHPAPILDLSGQLLTLCKCGIDTIAPMECTKWMASTWDCTLDHGGVHWASQLTMDCSSVLVFTLELPWIVFDKLLPPPSPPPPLCPTHPPPKLCWLKISAHLQKIS